MNQDTLVLLSGMAPKEPEQWALDEWGAKFEADYPKPWGVKFCGAWADASMATSKAKYACAMSLLDMGDSLGYVEMVSRSVVSDYPVKSDELQAWQSWRRECLAEFTRNEWPLLWAKKRMQAAGVAEKIHCTCNYRTD